MTLNLIRKPKVNACTARCPVGLHGTLSCEREDRQCRDASQSEYGETASDTESDSETQG